MRKIIVIFYSLILLSGCKNERKKELDLSEFLRYDKKTKRLIVDFNKIDNFDINSVEFETKRNLKHVIFLNSMKQIEQIENSINIGNEGLIKNTWYTFDKQTNLNVERSFYYDSYILSKKDDDSSYLTYDILFNLYGGEHYALVGDYDKKFSLKPNSQIDTLWKIKDAPFIMIPIDTKNKKNGWNNIRFIVYEDQRKGDTITRKRTFVDRDYFIEREK